MLDGSSTHDPMLQSKPDGDVMGTDAREGAKDDRYRVPALDKRLESPKMLSEQSDRPTRAEIVTFLGRNSFEI